MAAATRRAVSRRRTAVRARAPRAADLCDGVRCPPGRFLSAGLSGHALQKSERQKSLRELLDPGSPGVASARVLGGGRPARGCGVQFARPFFSHRRRGVHNSMEPSEKGGRGDGSGCEQRRCGADVRVRRWCGAGRVSMRAVVLAVCLLPCTCSAFSTVLLRCCAV